jgi:hypothetical protein
MEANQKQNLVTKNRAILTNKIIKTMMKPNQIKIKQKNLIAQTMAENQAKVIPKSRHISSLNIPIITENNHLAITITTRPTIIIKRARKEGIT